MPSLRGQLAYGRRYSPQYFAKEADDIADEDVKLTQDDEEVTEISADQLASIIAESTPEPNRITVGLNVKKSAELPEAAYDIAEFVNILREQTEETFTLDIRAGIGEDGGGGRKAPVVGFLAEDDEDDEEGGEDLRRTYRKLRVDTRN